MRYLLFLFIPITLTACAVGNPQLQGTASINGMTTTAYKMKLSDGTDVWHITCPGWANDWGNCWERANALCPKGFTLIKQQSSSGGAAGVAVGDLSAVGQSAERQAFVKCN